MSTVDERTAEMIKAANRRQKLADTVPWWHTFHRWTRWEQSMAEVTATTWSLGGERAVQIRHCVRCDKMQVRRLRVGS